ncbi:MAG: hypothetical protein PHD88_08155 [Firmicutes bacterium]|nr:hypothetical protein [Bacillota bacterium]MDD4263433.1 hypothetical protein [Bacillota bacterium]MDD4694349.1 hypothetical protein [Bacillota bacterium]
MRKNILAVLLLVFVLVFGTSTSAITKTVKLNLIDGSYYAYLKSAPLAVDFETKMNDRFSFVAGGSIGILGILGANAGLRYYINPGTMQGIYGEGRVTGLGAFLLGGGVVVGGAGVTGGYKHVFENGFTLDGGAGIASMLFAFGGGGGDFDGGFGFHPTLDIRLGLGYSW